MAFLIYVPDEFKKNTKLNELVRGVILEKLNTQKPYITIHEEEIAIFKRYFKSIFVSTDKYKSRKYINEVGKFKGKRVVVVKKSEEVKENDRE